MSALADGFLGIVSAMTSGLYSFLTTRQIDEVTIAPCSHDTDCDRDVEARRSCNRQGCPHRKSSATAKGKKHSADDSSPALGPDNSGSANKRAKRSASQTRDARSSSRNRSRQLLDHSERYAAGGSAAGLQPKDAKDFSSIAIYSREASQNFARGYRKLFECADPTKRVIPNGVSPTDVINQLALLGTSVVSTGLQDQLRALLAERTPAHVIVVIEGSEDPSSFRHSPCRSSRGKSGFDVRKSSLHPGSKREWPRQ